ncbi:MAG: spore coat protein [Ruminococcaceae bacterium]|nr:spore coat protein [Oscillospiraceae bacterium]
MTFTQKETTLLKDLKSQEELCIEKYGKYAADACDGELKNLFTTIRSTEQQHLSTVNGYLGETSPAATAPVPTSDGCGNQDKFLCQDALNMEKHVSSVYDVCIFEFSDTAVRQKLNQIQADEQKHGEMIYQYMSKHGMY